MRAIYIDSPGQVSIKDLPMPVLLDGDALLKPLYGGICGSDLGAYRGAFPYFAYPQIPGHELAAEIAYIPRNTRGLKAGTLVTCNPYFNCGHCYSCKKGLVNACMENQTMGVQREGGFAEYIRMPISRLINGKGLPAKTLALIEPFCISEHGVSRLGLQRGDRVLVVGAGTIGVLAAVAAMAKGAEVYIADVSQQKLDYAMGLGIKGAILNLNPFAFAEEVKEVTQGNGFDATVEAVGLPSTLQNCLDSTCFGGRVAILGVGKHNIDLDFTIIQKRELNIYGSRNALTADFENLIQLVSTRGIELDRIVTNVYDFDDAARAFWDFSQNAASMLKVLIKF